MPEVRPYSWKQLCCLFRESAHTKRGKYGRSNWQNRELLQTIFPPPEDMAIHFRKGKSKAILLHQVSKHTQQHTQGTQTKANIWWQSKMCIVPFFGIEISYANVYQPRTHTLMAKVFGQTGTITAVWLSHQHLPSITSFSFSSRSSCRLWSSSSAQHPEETIKAFTEMRGAPLQTPSTPLSFSVLSSLVLCLLQSPIANSPLSNYLSP